MLTGGPAIRVCAADSITANHSDCQGKTTVRLIRQASVNLHSETDFQCPAHALPSGGETLSLERLYREAGRV